MRRLSNVLFSILAMSVWSVGCAPNDASEDAGSPSTDAGNGSGSDAGTADAGTSGGGGGSTGTCATPISVTCESTNLSFDTANGGNGVDGYGCDEVFSDDYTGKELVFELTSSVATVATVSASKLSMGFTTYKLFQLETNPCAGEAVCAAELDNTIPESANDSLTFDVLPGQPVFLAYDVRVADETTEFSLSVSCRDAVCGNGFIELDEECDDGNASAGDGCSSTCTKENGFVCNGEPSICAAAGSNDLCSAAQSVSLAVLDTETTVEGTLVGATGNLNEPLDCIGFCTSECTEDAGVDVFYDFVSDVAGILEVKIEADGTFGWVLSSPESCEQTIAPADRCVSLSPSLLEIPVEAGDHTLIAVDGRKSTDVGTFLLKAKVRTPVTDLPPLTPGETCALAAPVMAPAAGESAVYQVSLEGFSDDFQLPTGGCSSMRAAGKDGFLRITTPSAGELKIRTDGMDTVLYTYAGAECSGEPSHCADNGLGILQGDVLTVPTTENGVLTLAIDTFATFSTDGLITLTLEAVAP